jgi:hypothetical protein
MLGDVLCNAKEQNVCLKFIFSFMLGVCIADVPTTFIMKRLCLRITDINIYEFVPQNGYFE